ncbi:MAG TPA: hypothetical protein VMH00_17090 [Candidatus Limnocylindrales bacterium]|nr:hypothetical protein [Candidatus Limnocylindrales bacterium]
MSHRKVFLGALVLGLFHTVPYSHTVAYGQQVAPQSASTPASAQIPPSPPTSQTPPKKVWTNDDVTDLRDQSAISTVGNQGSKATGAGHKTEQASRNRDASWYRGQIEKLQAKIVPLDDKIGQLQAALDGQTVSSTRQYGGVRPDDWRDQLARLQKERDDIDTRIAQLRDEARHAGVAVNAIP